MRYIMLFFAFLLITHFASASGHGADKKMPKFKASPLVQGPAPQRARSGPPRIHLIPMPTLDVVALPRKNTAALATIPEGNEEEVPSSTTRTPRVLAAPSQRKTRVVVLAGKLPSWEEESEEEDDEPTAWQNTDPDDFEIRDDEDFLAGKTLAFQPKRQNEQETQNTTIEPLPLDEDGFVDFSTVKNKAPKDGLKSALKTSQSTESTACPDSSTCNHRDLLNLAELKISEQHQKMIQTNCTKCTPASAAQGSIHNIFSCKLFLDFLFGVSEKDRTPELIEKLIKRLNPYTKYAPEFDIYTQFLRIFPSYRLSALLGLLTPEEYNRLLDGKFEGILSKAEENARRGKMIALMNLRKRAYAVVYEALWS